MANVTANKPEPVTPPPTTYDITGLTQREADALLSLLGRVSAGDAYDIFGADHLYNQLHKAGAELGKFDVRSTDSFLGGPLAIRLTPRG